MNEFFKNIRIELKKITWPTDKEMKKYTSQVFVFMLCLILFFGVVDGIIAQGIAWANPSRITQIEEDDYDYEYDYEYDDEEESN